jgi:quercetin dioxygenase-like cupin family protein
VDKLTLIQQNGQAMKRIKLILLVIIALPLLYLGGGLYLHNYMYPTHTPEYRSYFRDSSRFSSKWEKITFQIMSFNPEKGTIRVNMEIAPGGEQIAAHEHDFFTERFIVQKGKLSAIINGKSSDYAQGQELVIAPGVTHKLFNNTDSTVILSDAAGKGFELPIDYVYALSQLYGHWDADIANRTSPKLYFHLAILHKQFDSWSTEKAPSKSVQKMLRICMAPTARLLKYEIYDYRFTPLLAGEAPME